MIDKPNNESAPWTEGEVTDGYREVALSSWREFGGYVENVSNRSHHLIYRGQADDCWQLEPRIDRLLKDFPEPVRDQLRKDHLERFRLAIRGRRGTNPPDLAEDNDFWCLGQHYGLATPLLDWTVSPFVALHFAFLEENTTAKSRAVYLMQDEVVSVHSKVSVINYNITEELNRPDLDDTDFLQKMSLDFAKELRRPAIVEILQPATDENPRLVSQGALLTKGKDGLTLEDWVRKSFKKSEDPILTKLSIPNKDRGAILKSLSRMNINHLSLFPDLYGSSEYCNRDIEIKNY